MRRPQTSSVPSTAQVRPGAAVHIVLKQDQPTGRQVHGIVRDVLTSGNHPRGIKVRLADGRVGRVQRMGDTSAASSDVGGGASIDGGAGLIWDAQDTVASSEARGFRGRGPRLRAAEGPVNGDGEAKPAEQLGLDAYIKPAKQRKGRKGRGQAAASGASTADDVLDGGPSTSSTTETLLDCPVCGDFRGDEASVALHVGVHFD